MSLIYNWKQQAQQDAVNAVPLTYKKPKEKYMTAHKKGQNRNNSKI